MKTLMAVLLVSAFPALLRAEDMVLAWKDIPRSLVEQRYVKVRLADQCVLDGKAVSVTPSGLQMQIMKVRGRKSSYKPGESIVPAEQIENLGVDRSGTRGRIIGSAIGGGMTVFALASVIANATNEESGGAAALGAASFIPLGIGYALGRLRDRHTVNIHVLRGNWAANQ
jgi:hypothetical protein